MTRYTRTLLGVDPFPVGIIHKTDRGPDRGSYLFCLRRAGPASDRFAYRKIAMISFIT